MSATDCVSCAVQIPRKFAKVLSFDQLHALSIQALDRIMNEWLVIKLVCEAEALTPVTEVARNNKHCLVVQE